MVSGAVLHSLPSGTWFDLRRRELLAGPSTPGPSGRHPRSVAAKRSPATATKAARERTKRGPSERKPAAQPRPEDRLLPRLPGTQLLVLRALRPAARRPGSLEHWPSNTIPGFNAKLLKLLPGCGRALVFARHAGAGSASASRTAPGSGTSPSTWRSSSSGSRARTSRAGRPAAAGEQGQYNVIYGYAEERVGVEAGELAVRLSNHLVKADPAFDFDAELERLILLAERRQFGPSTQAILDEAMSRDIPWMRLNEYSLVQLGQGKYQQRIRATMTSKTCALAVDIAGDKKMTNQLLAAAGLPVPRSEVVRDADDAVPAAKRIGFPVVTKPLDGNHGRGVGLDLRTEKAVRGGFRSAQEQARRGQVDRGVLRDRQRLPGARDRRAHGRDRRTRSRPTSSATAGGRWPELVEQTNKDPRRGIGHEKVLTRITVDEAAVALVKKQGYGLDDVPPKGATVLLADDRQHVDRRDLDRPHLGGARGQRRDRRGGGPGRRPRRRRDRLPRARYHAARPRDRRRDRRGERGARVPDAHAPDRGGAAVRGEARRRPAVPAGDALADPDHRGDRARTGRPPRRA